MDSQYLDYTGSLNNFYEKVRGLMKSASYKEADELLLQNLDFINQHREVLLRQATFSLHSCLLDKLIVRFITLVKQKQRGRADLLFCLDQIKRDFDNPLTVTLPPRYHKLFTIKAGSDSICVEGIEKVNKVLNERILQLHKISGQKISIWKPADSKASHDFTKRLITDDHPLFRVVTP